VTQQPDKEINVKGLEIQITELLRLELEIQEDLSRQQRDLERVREQRELLQTQVTLIREKQLGQETE